MDMDDKKNLSPDVEPLPEEGIVEDYAAPSTLKGFLQKLMTAGVELRGLEPVSPENRTHTKYYNIMTLFGGSFLSILPLSIGSTPTLVFGLRFRDAAILFVTMHLLFILPTLYILTLAPQLGMRQSVQFRYVFGKYPNILVSLSVILEIGIFGMTAAVGGAQCLAAVRPGTLSVEGAICIIFVIAFAIAFVGYSAIHLIAQYIWLPNAVCLIVLAVCAGSHLSHQPAQTASGAAPYLATIAICASSMITWGTIIGDYSCYMPPNTPKFRLVASCFVGLYVPYTLMSIFGAAIGGAVSAIPSWEAAYGQGSLGGVLGEILVPRVGNFGRFCLVILGLSMVITSARDMYSISLFTVAVIPWLRRIPRVAILTCATGSMIGIAIAASRSFLPSLSTLVSIAGYVTGPVVCVFLLEWGVFRKAKPSSFDPAIWNDTAALPSGMTAVFAAFAPWAIIIPSMSSVWYVGPIAAHVGDLAWELGTACSAVLYLPLRALEIKYRGRY